MSVSLGKVRSFVALAVEGHFGRAAERLGISQPTLSVQIRELEAALEVQLITRTTRSVRLTSEGERFRYRAEKILEDMDAAVRELREQASLSRGRIIIAASPGVAATILPSLIKAFSGRFPDVNIHLHEAMANGIGHLVETGVADFGLGPAYGRASALSFEPLFSERFFAVVPLGHPLASGKSVKLRQLFDEAFLTTAPGSGVRDAVESLIRDRGLQLTSRHLVDRQETIVAMVAAGLGVSLLPALTLASVSHHHIRAVEMNDPPLHRTIGIIQRKGGSNSAAAHEFLALCRSGELFDAARDHGLSADAEARRLLEELFPGRAIDRALP